MLSVHAEFHNILFLRNFLYSYNAVILRQPRYMGQIIMLDQGHPAFDIMRCYFASEWKGKKLTHVTLCDGWADGGEIVFEALHGCAVPILFCTPPCGRYCCNLNLQHIRGYSSWNAYTPWEGNRFIFLCPWLPLCCASLISYTPCSRYCRNSPHIRGYSSWNPYSPLRKQWTYFWALSCHFVWFQLKFVHLCFRGVFFHFCNFLRM